MHENTTGAPAAQQILLTGATGFLGQAVLQALLENHPNVQITTLIRPKGTQTGRKRLEGLIRKPVFASWAERSSDEVVREAIASRVHVLEGDLETIRDVGTSFDTVIHSASTVSFDPPIDEAFRVNVGGAQNLYQALLESGQDPHVIHVSTAYVGGISKGLRQEGSLVHDVDWRAEYSAALGARERAEQESRRPENLRSLMKAARARDGKMGPKAVAAAAEEQRKQWVHDRLIDYGRTRAQSVGWTDIYTFTKAMAERVAETMWRDAGHRVSFVRPSIIESALNRPFPGWIDGYKVADPLIMAYGKGLLPEFPGLADSILDIIPVDFVVNVIVALATQNVQRTGDEAYYQVVSGASNPLPFHAMVSAVRDYFLQHPLTDDKGQKIIVPSWNFPSVDLVEKKFLAKEKSISAAQLVATRLPATQRTRSWVTSLHKNASGLATLRKYMELYKQYTQTEMVFDDANTRALRASLPPEYLERADFDVTGIDWRTYFKDLHLPAVTNLTKAFSRRKATLKARNARPTPPPAPAEGALAVFDLDGTMVAQNIVQQYIAVVRATKPRSAWPAEFAKMLGSVPAYLRAEQRDRGEFIRTFTRRYQGYRRSDLEKLFAGELGGLIRDSIRPEALARLEEHRAAGHRTVLVTGAIDVLVSPLLDLFDEVVAGRMHEDNGVMTGYLATPPLVDEARANWLHKYAAQHGADLKASYGYGDSHADVSWLALVGHPHAVRPDLGLYQVAKKQHWTILDW
ncbi:HAD-IB family hydrolase [Devriesea agamarum]|uniref:HAD-IB family hydrolase n=1 Tax=Devriesea agamarum TaxID=472569 RepID=UPI00071DFBF7|nr:HAD-IB family hydrolase [Devriesea agamarum]